MLENSLDKALRVSSASVLLAHASDRWPIIHTGRLKPLKNPTEFISPSASHSLEKDLEFPDFLLQPRPFPTLDVMELPFQHHPQSSFPLLGLCMVQLFSKGHIVTLRRVTFLVKGATPANNSGVTEHDFQGFVLHHASTRTPCTPYRPWYNQSMTFDWWLDSGPATTSHQQGIAHVPAVSLITPQYSNSPAQSHMSIPLTPPTVVNLPCFFYGCCNPTNYQMSCNPQFKVHKSRNRSQLKINCSPLSKQSR